MMKRRKTKETEKLTNGPGKWTQAFGIKRRHNRIDLIKDSGFYIGIKETKKYKITAGPRIGIRQGLDKMWRFYSKDSKFISV